MSENDGDHNVAVEEIRDSVVDLIENSKTESMLQAVREKIHALFDHHVDTKKTITQLLNGVVQAEESVGEKLLDLEGQKNQTMRELERLGQEIQQSLTKSSTLESEQQFLQRELERLRDSEQEIQTLQQEVDEDTTEVIPSAIYLAQLYYKVTKIKLELETEPHILRGVHYGADLATPIHIDTSTRSACAVSDELWSLVSTEW